MKHLKKFNEISEYDTFKNSSDYILPNVSYIVEDNSVCFENETKKEQYFPNNTIIYTSKWQLTETSDVSNSKTGYPGLYTNGFSNDGKLLTIVNHMFTKNDGESYGIGVIEFDGDVTSIDYRAFNETEIVTLELPSTVRVLAKEAIYECAMLTSITSYAELAPSVDSSSFTSISDYGVLYYPKESDYSSWMKYLPGGWTAKDI